MQKSEAENPLNQKKIIIDLCSGSGSATGIWQSMGYTVYRYDIVGSPRHYTHLRDLSNPDQCRQIIHDHRNDDILLIWASPPCTEYSDANKLTYDPEFIPDTMIWRNCMGIIDGLDPDFWIIENVRGAQRTWGEARQKHGAYYLWGNFPVFNVFEKIPAKGVRSFRSNIRKSDRARWSAIIPLPISLGLYRAIVGQNPL